MGFGRKADEEEDSKTRSKTKKLRLWIPGFDKLGHGG